MLVTSGAKSEFAFLAVLETESQHVGERLELLYLASDQ